MLEEEVFAVVQRVVVARPPCPRLRPLLLLLLLLLLSLSLVVLLLATRGAVFACRGFGVLYLPVWRRRDGQGPEAVRRAVRRVLGAVAGAVVQHLLTRARMKRKPGKRGVDVRLGRSGEEGQCRGVKRARNRTCTRSSVITPCCSGMEERDRGRRGRGVREGREGGAGGWEGSGCALVVYQQEAHEFKVRAK